MNITMSTVKALNITALALRYYYQHDRPQVGEDSYLVAETMLKTISKCITKAGYPIDITSVDFQPIRILFPVPCSQAVIDGAFEAHQEIKYTELVYSDPNWIDDVREQLTWIQANVLETIIS